MSTRKSGTKILALFTAAAMVVTLCGVAMAQAQSTAPGAQEMGSVKYLSTGIGAETRKGLPAYPLKLTFATKSGKLLANVAVKIMDAKGEKILEVTSDPILLVDLKPGEYTIEAVSNNVKITRKVTITEGKHTSQIFSWPVGQVKMGSEPSKPEETT